MTTPAPAGTGAVLHLVTLGRLALLGASGEEEPTLAARRTKLALLAYLALQRRPVPRGALAALLWGEKPEERARGSLSEALSHFRRVLGHDALAGYQDDVALDAGGALVVDAWLLEGAARERDHAQVAALYAGPFLDGVAIAGAPEWERWAARERLRLEELFVASCAPQCTALARARRWSECAALAERWLEARPASEDAALYLLNALKAPGTRDAAIAALDAWRRLTSRLREEWDLAPAPAAARLAAEIERTARAPDTGSAAGVALRRTPSVGAMLHHVRAAEAAAAGALPPGDLPMPTTPMVGREEEARTVAALLRAARLVTLTGPGGIGKTRLAMHVAAVVAAEHDAAYWIPLAAVADPALVLPTIAARLGATGGERDHARAIAERVGGRRVLLALDNLEQLAADATPVAALLAAAAGVRVLATSQTPLHLAGEHVLAVPPLALAPPEADAGAVARSAAAALFAQRARAAAPAFAIDAENAAAVAALCARLDGIPLAIELAASRVRVLPPRAMLARLTSLAGPLDALPASGARDAPARHRTLRAALGWMHDQLDEGERALFRRLAVFAGSASPDAVEAVCGGAPVGDAMDALDALAERSLLVIEADADGEIRVRQLETLRALARERLVASGEELASRRRHAEWCVRVAEAGAPGEWEATARVDRERDELRVALAWAREGEPEMAGRLTRALRRHWVRWGMPAEESALEPVPAELAEGAALGVDSGRRVTGEGRALHEGC